MSLGGTFMVIYASYMRAESSITKNALWTGLGDTLAGLLAGLAIFPAVFALGLQPGEGPSLTFSILPKTFALMPGGWFFGLIFFGGFLAAAFLSDVAAFEVLVGGLVDNTKLSRKKAVLLVCSAVFIVAIPPLINMEIFFRWDLTFGSGMQILGALLSVITSMWCIKRSAALKELGGKQPHWFHHVLYWWMRLVIPLVILCVGLHWLAEL